MPSPTSALWNWETAQLRTTWTPGPTGWQPRLGGVPSYWSVRHPSRSTSLPSPRRLTWRVWTPLTDGRGSRRISAGRTQLCTPASRGPSASTPGTPRPRKAMPSTGATWPPASGASAWPSTWPPTGATTATTRGWPATSGWQGCPSTPSSTCARSLRGSRWTG